MKSTTRMTLSALALVAIVGAGLTAAHPGFRGTNDDAEPAWGLAACDDEITVGECRALLQAQRESRAAELHAACIEKHGEEACEEMYAQRGKGPMRHGPPGGPGGPHGPGPWAQDSDDDTTSDEK